MSIVHAKVSQIADGASTAIVQPSDWNADHTVTTINLTGGQIAFPATQSASAGANTLDDYEEALSGGWTPTLTFVTPGDLSVAYSAQHGVYVKVGKVVVASFRVTTSTFTHTTAASSLRLSGLPFTVASGTGATSMRGGPVVAAGYTATDNQGLTAVAQTNTTYAVLSYSRTGAAINNMGVNHFLTGASVDIFGTITYEANA